MIAALLAAAAVGCSITPAGPGVGTITPHGLAPLPTRQFYRISIYKPDGGINEYDLQPGEESALYFSAPVAGSYTGEVAIVKNFGGGNLHGSFQRYTLLATCSARF